MLLGKHPFDLDNLRQLLFQIVNEQPDFSALTEPLLLPVLQRLLAKTPAERYANAHAVIHDLYAVLDESLPPEREAIRESFLQAAVFVGRQRELSQLTEGLDTAVSGQVSAWLIGGESGVGKSRLLDELRIAALVKGGLVLRGQAVAEGGLRYQLWRDVLPPLILATALSDFEASVLQEIVPHIDTLIARPVAPLAPLTGNGQHQRLSETVCSVFKRQTRLTVLMLEDLHWTTESLDILRDLLFAVTDVPLAIFGSYRDDESPHLAEQLPQMRQITLERLSSEEVAELSHAMIGDAASQANVVEFVTRETEGNPFFLVEVMRALAMDAGRLLQIGSKTLPDQVFTGGIQQIVQQRIRQIPEWGRHLARIAAIAGRLLDLTVLEQILRDTPDTLSMSLDNWLTVCADVHILSISNNRWQFSHDKIREQIIRDTQPEAQPQLHTLVATAIETCYPNDPARVEILMNHWKLAGNTDKELVYLNLAVERLVWFRGEYQQGITLLQRGLSLLPKRDARAVNLLNHLSESYWRMGQFDEAKRYGLRAKHLGEKLNVPHDRARSLGNLGIIARMQRRHGAAKKYFTESLKLRRELHDLTGIARSYANLGILAYSRGKLETARRYYLRSLKLQRQLGDENALILNLLNIGEVLSTEGKHDEAEKYIRRCLRIARKIGNRYTIAASLNTLGVAAFLQQKYQVAADYLLQAADAFHAIRNQYGLLHTLGYLVNALPIDDPALRLRLIEGLTLASTMQQEYFILFLVIGAARWYLHQQNPARAAALIEYAQQHPAAEDQFKKLVELVLKRDGHILTGTHHDAIPADQPINQIVSEVITDLNRDTLTP